MGRHPMRMSVPAAPAGAPSKTLSNLLRPMQHLDAALRTYAHPDLLRVAEALNGADFVPFTETVFLKQARLGSSTAWHQVPPATSPATARDRPRRALDTLAVPVRWSCRDTP